VAKANFENICGLLLGKAFSFTAFFDSDVKRFQSYHPLLTYGLKGRIVIEQITAF
jgi:hypothetical protein